LFRRLKKILFLSHAVVFGLRHAENKVSALSASVNATSGKGQIFEALKDEK
jgi:hypothetical protein